MRKTRQKILAIAFGLIVGAGLALAVLQPPAIASQGLGLLNRPYHADIAGQPVTGLHRNLSGLTRSDRTGTLFSVINRPPQIVELTESGTLLRVIALDGFRDPEGITHVAGDIFLIADEGEQTLHRVVVSGATTRIVRNPADDIETGIFALHNLGIEGISWDSARNRLFLAQEMLPMRVLMLQNFDDEARPLAGGYRMTEWHPHTLSSRVTLDLSSLTLHEETGHLLLLSHLSGTIVEYDPTGTMVGQQSLAAGHGGLSQSIAQAEGIAIGPDGTIFVVSEPNLFYRFRPGALPR